LQKTCNCGLVKSNDVCANTKYSLNLRFMQNQAVMALYSERQKEFNHDVVNRAVLLRGFQRANYGRTHSRFWNGHSGGGYVDVRSQGRAAKTSRANKTLLRTITRSRITTFFTEIQKHSDNEAFVHAATPVNSTARSPVSGKRRHRRNFPGSRTGSYGPIRRKSKRRRWRCAAPSRIGKRWTADGRTWASARSPQSSSCWRNRRNRRWTSDRWCSASAWGGRRGPPFKQKNLPRTGIEAAASAKSFKD